MLPCETKFKEGISLTTRILTTKWVIRKKRANKSENIHEYFPLLHNAEVPSYISSLGNKSF